ncbi:MULTISPECIES: ABC transporter substrate-binding protein [unclassified Devosia]|uniref:ABC transporter substrate-binding protein n=1 Tax=unclassified Devosia TaxID=196773 RepID=UPI001554DB47|nr:MULTISPECIES: ABC transporter substrate-binding protein [unclassified Devosia]
MRKTVSLCALALAATCLPAFAQQDPDTLVVAQSVDVESLEPDMLNQSASLNVATALWGTLLSITREGEIVPNLAESYEWNEAGNELSFKIRPGLKCEDGETLDAEDVAYSFTRAADPANKFIGHTPGFVYSSIGYVGARAEDATTAVLQVKGYSSTVPGMAARILIHCKDSYEKMSVEEAAGSPVASGPYKLVEWVRADRVVLTRNENWTLSEVPFENVVFRVIPESSTRTAELLAGQVDIAVNIPPDQMETVNNSGQAQVVSVAGTRRMFAGFNFSGAFDGTPVGEAFKKVEVRRALNMAVDVPTICKQLLSTDCVRANGPANLGNPQVEPYPYDPDQAEAMLDAAGYPRGEDGVRFTVQMQGPQGRYLQDGQVQQALAQYLSDVGVETTNDLMDMTIFSPMAREHRAGPMFFIGQGGATWSAIYDMSLFPSRDAPVNTGNWFNQEWQTRWDSLSGLRDPVEERRIVDEMLKIFHDDAPWIFMYFQPDFYGVSNRIDWQPRRDEALDVWTASLK